VTRTTFVFFFKNQNRVVGAEILINFVCICFFLELKNCVCGKESCNFFVLLNFYEDDESSGNG